MSLALEKYYTNSDGEKKIDARWKKHQARCIAKTSYYSSLSYSAVILAKVSR